MKPMLCVGLECEVHAFMSWSCVNKLAWPATRSTPLGSDDGAVPPVSEAAAAGADVPARTSSKTETRW